MCIGVKPQNPAINYKKPWAFLERRLDLLPAPAYDLLDSLDVLWAGLGLDSDTWNAWHGAVIWAEPDPDDSPPRYTLTPERLPEPPGNPSEALAAAADWTYEPTPEGLAHLVTVLALANAATVAELKKV